MIATIYSQTEMNWVIIMAVLFIGVALLVGFIYGYRKGREEEREEVKITKRQRARRLLVVRTARAFCPKNGSVITQVELPPKSEWFTPRIV